MRARKGVSLIEVMVALTLFGLIATVHTVATMRFGLRTRVVALGAQRAAAVAAAMDMYSTMPRGSLPAANACTTITNYPAFRHQRCVTVSSPTSTIRRLTVRIVPSNTALKPDTLIIDRVVGAGTPVFQ